MSDYYQVVTPENVELDLEIAGIGSRFLAMAIDFSIQTILIIGLTALLVGLKLTDLASKPGDWFSSTLGATLLIISLIIGFGYHIVLEALMNGQTIGKKLVNIRVRKERGYAPNFWDILLRNIIRPIDFLPSFYAIGLITMFVNPKAKRLGDYAAGTIVVKELSRRKIDNYLNKKVVDHPEFTESPDNPWVNTFGPYLKQADYLLLKNLLERQSELDNFPFLAQRFLRKLAQDLPEEPTWLMTVYAPDLIKQLVTYYEKIHFV